MSENKSLINKNFANSKSARAEYKARNFASQNDSAEEEVVDLRNEEIEKLNRRLGFDSVPQKEVKKSKKGRVLFILAPIAVVIVVVFLLSRLNSNEEDLNYTEVKVPKRTNYEETNLTEPLEFFPSNITVEYQVDAAAILAYNPDTFQIYTEYNADEELKIASITKLLSALVVLDDYDLDAEVVTQELPEDLEWGIGLEVGGSMTAEDALYAMMLSSYNDAGLTVAQNHPDGGMDKFLERMNEKAQLYGMEDSHFSSPVGYDFDDNYSTANDLKKLVTVVLNTPELLEILELNSIDVVLNGANGESEVMTVYTSNWMLGTDPSVKGLKTGYTAGAQQCFVGYFDNEGDRLVTIIIGTEFDRFGETQELLGWIRESF